MIKKECRFAVHIPSLHPDTPDVHMVKEVLHLEDGTTQPNIRFIKDFKRSFYVTKPQCRDHKQNKEYEHISKLDRHISTQSEMTQKLKVLLDKQWSNDRLRQLSSSPYVYGTDITSTALIKHGYRTAYPDTITPFKLAVLDIETDVVNGTDEILMVSITTNDKIVTSIVKSFVSGFGLPINDIKVAIDKHIPKYVQGKDIEILLADTPTQAIKDVFKRVHEWKPDWLAIWNIDFDLPRIIATLKKSGVSVEDVMSDPKVPKEFRVFKYKQGIKKKTTASGKVIPINPAMQWHTVKNTASFTFIDAMCVYKQLRLMGSEEPSYSLDAILDKELGIRKLKFEATNQYTGLKWHQVMQSKYKIEYVVYNIFDCLGIIELDKKTKDLELTLPMFAGITDFEFFKSQPKRILDALYMYLLDSDHVLSGGVIPDDEKNKTLGLKQWILTLPSHLSVLGLKLIKEDENIHTNIRTHVMDSDAVSAYPSATMGLNVSKSTTLREIHRIVGMKESKFVLNNLDLLSGMTNSVTYSTDMFNMIKPSELL